MRQVELGIHGIKVVDGVEPSEILEALGPDVDGAQRAEGKQLDVMRGSDLYLRSGSFSPSEIVSCWKAAISDVMYDGRFEIVRAVETWSLQDVVPPLGELVALESEMNRYLLAPDGRPLGHGDGSSRASTSPSTRTPAGTASGPRPCSPP